MPIVRKKWALALLYTLLAFCVLAALLGGTKFNPYLTYTSLAFILLHAGWTLSIQRGLFFILLAALSGFAAEAISLNYMTLFGGQYTYAATRGILGVPIDAIIFWPVIIYVGYWLVTTFRYWLGNNKAYKGHDNLGQVGLMVVADGLSVTAIDLFMDPVKIREGVWHWVNGGPYFGVPIGNFVGWFVLTVFVTGIFRLFEYYRPQKAILRDSMYLLPVFAYLLIGVTCMFGAIKYNLPGLVIIGVTITILPAGANLFLYSRRKAV